MPLQGGFSLASLTAGMPGFAAELRGVTYITLCHSLADTMSLKQVSLPCCYLAINLRWLRTPGTRNAPPRRAATGRSLHNGALRFYRCGGVIDTGHRYWQAPLPESTASGRNRIRSWNAAPRRPPRAGRRWPPPDRPAPRPRRTPSYRPRSRSHPPRPHAGWSPR